TRLTVATWNVLREDHDPASTLPIQRRSLLLDELRSLDAEILALQEVTPALWDVLLAQDWIRGYFVSEPPGGPTLHPHGIVLLSRRPFTLIERAFTPPWRALLGTWEANGGPLHVAAVHLPSDRARDGAAERQRQLAALLEYLESLPGDALVAGDLN